MSRIRNTERVSCSRSRQLGFSLIELMVASAVGLMIMAAILTLYLNVTRTNEEMAKTNSLIENGRFALQLLEDDLAHAGFWDGYVPDFDDLSLSSTVTPTAIPTGVPQPCLGESSWNDAVRTNRLGIAVQAYSSLPSGCSSTLLSNQKSNTDFLVVRHAHTVPTCLTGQTEGCEQEVAEALYFQSSRCEDDDIDDDPYVLDTDNFDLHKKDCIEIAPKRRYVSNIYYVRDYAVTVGDNIPTLVRSEFDLQGGSVIAKEPQTLVEGVEGFRVELGVDRISDNGTDIVDLSSNNDLYRQPIDWADTSKASPRNRGDGIPDEFVHCTSTSGSGPSDCPVDRLINVVAVKVYLLVRSRTATSGYVDGKSYALGGQAFTVPTADVGYKRHVFSTLVRLNNVSARRETP